MRRCFTARPLQALTSFCAASTAVAAQTPAAAAVGRIGVPVTRDEVAAVHKVPSSILDRTHTPRVVAYTGIELIRTKHPTLIASIDDKTHFLQLERLTSAKFEKNPAALKPVPGALKKFRETTWTDMTALMTFYEETMYPIRRKHAEYLDHELTSFHIKDVLKRGLSAFKQDYLDTQKEEQKVVLARMKECKDFIQTAASDAFDTALFNDLVNLVRVGGEAHEHAHSMALKLLEDMNMMGIPYDAMTREIMKAVVFNDGPYDDSGLLFEIIEYPERGEISLSRESLEKVSDDMLKLISNRHQTPLDAGKLLRSKETHPNLQRSVE